MAMKLIEEAVTSGARQHKACEVVGISVRTVRRWSQEGNDLADKRAQAARQRQHPQALTEQEKQAMVQVCNSAEFASLPPSQIVPRLADRGQYLASESSFYRVLKAYGQQHHRGKAQPPKKVAAPQAWVATSANQVWSWDITYLPSTVRGQFLRLYMVLDVYGTFVENELVATAAVSRAGPFPSSHHKMVMWGVFTSPRYRRQGLSQQVVDTALQHAFDNGVHRVNLQVYVPNEPAITLYKAIGFVEYGKESEAVCLDGKYHDGVQMTLVKERHNRPL